MSQTTSTPARRVRRSLRVLLAALGVLVLAYAARPLLPRLRVTPRPDPVDAILVAEVERLGGNAWSMGVDPYRESMWVRHEVFRIALHGKKIDDSTLARVLTLGGDRVRNLVLLDTTVTDAGLVHLQGAPHLGSLILHAPRTDQSRSPITNAGLARLAGLNQIGALVMSGTSISDAGLRHLAGMPILTSLHLTHSEIRGPGLSSLAGLGHLQDLNLSDSPVGDGAVPALASLRQVETLRLAGTDVTRDSLAHLRDQGPTGLRYLEVPTLIGMEDMLALRKALPGIVIRWRSGGMESILPTPDRPWHQVTKGGRQPGTDEVRRVESESTSLENVEDRVVSESRTASDLP